MLPVTIAVSVTWLAFAGFAQTQPAAFEVATVKPSKSDGGINNRSDPVQATWTNAPLAIVIRDAYRIHSDQFVGGPSWIHSDRWDIVAKTDRPATSEQQSKMFQLLLTDRFKLKVHWEDRQLPQYRLVVAKGGPKVHAVRDDSNARPAGTRIGRGLIDPHRISTAELAGWLRSELGRPVVDSTGLTGKYDFNLQWAPDESQPSGGGEMPPPDSTGPSIFSAIQELGLKLEAMKGPVEVLVIDSVEKPSKN